MNLKKQISSKLQDYHLHKPTKKDIPIVIISVLIVFCIALTFYKNPIAVIFLFPLGIPLYEKLRSERLYKENHEIGQQFKDALISVVTSQKAGYSLENSFASSYKDMCKLYGEQSPICAELSRLIKGLCNNMVLEDLIEIMGERTKNAYIIEFANVFYVAKRSGGNITQMLEETVDQITNQAEVEKEIDVMISAGKMEARIMEAIPFAIINYVDISNPGFLDFLYGNIVGAFVMTVSLVIYIVACVWIEKIIQIEL